MLAMTERRSLTLLNECGDTTISWTEDRDDEMEAIIQKKMDEGITFFVVKRGRGQNLTERGPKLGNATEARKQRALVIPDEDLTKFVGSGAASVTRPPESPIESACISRDAKEVAKGQSVGVKQRRGG